MGATAAIAIVVKERHIVEAYQRAGATNPEAAATPDSLGVSQGGAFRILVRDAVLRETRPGFFYLDETSWADKRSTRQRIRLVMLVVLAVLLAGLAISGALNLRT